MVKFNSVQYELEYPVRGAAFLNEQTLLVTGGDNTGNNNKLTALSINLQKKKKPVKRFRELKLREGNATPTALDAKNNIILLGSNDSYERIQQLGQNANLQHFVYHNDHLKYISSASLEPPQLPTIPHQKLIKLTSDGKLAAVASSREPTVIRIWDPVKFAVKYEIESNNIVQDMDISPDGKSIAYITAHTLEIISIVTGSPFQRRTNFNGWELSKVKFQGNGQILLASVLVNNGGVQLAKLKINKDMDIMKEVLISKKAKDITSVDVNEKNGVIALSTTDNSVILLKHESLRKIKTFNNLHKDRITKLVFSPTGKLLASVSIASSINIIEIPDNVGIETHLIYNVVRNSIILLIIAVVARLGWMFYESRQSNPKIELSDYFTMKPRLLTSTESSTTGTIISLTSDTAETGIHDKWHKEYDDEKKVTEEARIVESARTVDSSEESSVESKTVKSGSKTKRSKRSKKTRKAKKPTSTESSAEEPRSKILKSTSTESSAEEPRSKILKSTSLVSSSTSSPQPTSLSSSKSSAVFSDSALSFVKSSLTTTKPDTTTTFKLSQPSSSRSGKISKQRLSRCHSKSKSTVEPVQTKLEGSYEDLVVEAEHEKASLIKKSLDTATDIESTTESNVSSTVESDTDDESFTESEISPETSDEEVSIVVTSSATERSPTATTASKLSRTDSSPSKVKAPITGSAGVESKTIPELDAIIGSDSLIFEISQEEPRAHSEFDEVEDEHNNENTHFEEATSESSTESASEDEPEATAEASVNNTEILTEVLSVVANESIAITEVEELKEKESVKGKEHDKENEQDAEEELSVSDGEVEEEDEEERESQTESDGEVEEEEEEEEKEESQTESEVEFEPELTAESATTTQATVYLTKSITKSPQVTSSISTTLYYNQSVPSTFNEEAGTEDVDELKESLIPEYSELEEPTRFEETTEATLSSLASSTDAFEESSDDSGDEADSESGDLDEEEETTVEDADEEEEEEEASEEEGSDDEVETSLLTVLDVLSGSADQVSGSTGVASHVASTESSSDTESEIPTAPLSEENSPNLIDVYTEAIEESETEEALDSSVESASESATGSAFESALESESESEASTISQSFVTQSTGNEEAEVTEFIPSSTTGIAKESELEETISDESDPILEDLEEEERVESDASSDGSDTEDIETGETEDIHDEL